MQIELEIKIEIENVDDFLQDIVREYECNVSEITSEEIVEYLSSNIKAKSTGCFNLIGFETDGWGVNRANTEGLEEVIRNYKE